jgi:hypothetical protein
VHLNLILKAFWHNVLFARIQIQKRPIRRNAQKRQIGQIATAPKKMILKISI